MKLFIFISLIIKKRKSILFGIGGGLLLMILYFLILSLFNSFSHAILQFNQMWYWILILAFGFGIQVGLYFYIRESQKMVSGKILATSGTISTGSMIACCLHHLVDVLPIIGLAAASVFLIKYQVLFIIIGILSNLIGITIMLEIIQKNSLAEGFLNRINMGQIKKITIGSSLILFLIAFFLINNREKISILDGTMIPSEVNNKQERAEIINLPSRLDTQAGISFTITPLEFNFNNPIKFEVRIDTHSGSLDFDLTQISILEDDSGNKYKPIDWQGSPPGGHHRSGLLIFPKINSQTKKLRLIIQDNYLRNFEWEL